ncbi:WxL domain-containing protein [Enterococcus casseliflavus]|uniref:WxL domain-containing protein n=1 Tax=Enterococcus casseliflavus TaxID=37734 RepID=UPI0025433964|nr:WxL domain-containing protein [Enterococcus casseliflavus]MDK4449668.1 WxL domain-containing protein [Enterococcus casseliflavus]
MIKQFFALTAAGLMLVSAVSRVAYAAETSEQKTSDTPQTNQNHSKVEVTMKPGSGTDVDPIVPDDTHDDDPSTDSVGSLSIPFASNITFGEQEIKQGDADYYALNNKPFVQVNDTRGGAGGWTLGVGISAFKGENDKELKGAVLSLSDGKVVTKDNESAAPVLAKTIYILNQNLQNLLLADKGQGAGAFAALFEGTDGQNEHVKLHVPRDGVEAQTYTAELKWVLTNAPA